MQDKFIIRFPDGMRERIKAAADTNGRTMTAEIVWRLEVSLDPNTKVLPVTDIHDMILTDHNEKLEAAWERLNWLDDHLKVDSRPERMKAKPRRAKKG